jgi:hypothetical protein
METSTQQHSTEESGGLEIDSEFKRDMGFWGNLALGFTYLSPVVGVYTTFAASLAIAGPPAFWMLVIAGFGQLLVACVFGEVVSQYPIAGGIYPWNRRLWGAKWGWISGWIYMIAINATIASVAYGAGPFLGALLGIEVNPTVNVLLALLLILLATLVNFGGTKLLSTSRSLASWSRSSRPCSSVRGCSSRRASTTSACSSPTSAPKTSSRARRSSSRSSARRSSVFTSTTASRRTVTSPKRCATLAA